MPISNWVNSNMDTTQLQTPKPPSAMTPATMPPPVEEARRTLTDVAQIKRIQTHGVFIKAYRVPAGLKLYSHKSENPHVTILAKGSVLMEFDDKKYRFIAPAHTEIPANTRAQVITLEESIWYCVHGTDETDLQKLIETFG